MRRSLSYAFGAFAIAAASAADATIYVANRTVGSTGSVSLSITTDDTVGALTPANILAFNIFVSDGVNNFTLTEANSIAFAVGLDLTATATDLSFNYDGAGYFIFRAPLGGGPFLCLQAATPCFDFAAPGEGLEPVSPDNVYEITRYTGTQIVASVAEGGVPEPATWAMMLVGFGAIGMAMRRNRRRAVLMQSA
jgi:PEP-CTERM motif-containing protein